MSAKTFRLPDLGEGLTEATLMRWLVSVGDTIVVDQPIAEVETAKSVVEVPSPFAGTVSALHGAEGELLLVGAPFVEVGDADGGAGSQTPPAEVEAEAYRAEEKAGSGNVLIGFGTKEAHSGGRKRRPRGVPAGVVTSAAPATGPVAVRSPLVRRLAQERGVDLHTVTPTGPDGIITRDDVLRATASRSGSAPARATERAAGDGGVVRTEPLSMLRRAVATKMSRSRTEIPEATVWVDVDVTELWATRAAMADPGTSTSAPSLTAMLARFVTAALAKYPVLASRLSADGSSLEYLDGIHLGIATDSDRGLLVPVIRHAEQLTIGQLDDEIRSLAEAARSGRIPPDQLVGSTFTLNNYGTFGVDGGSPIINHPEVAILGIGRMIERPWVVDGQIVPRRIAQVSLVFDHRVCDGGYATGFLRAVVDAMEHPMRMYRQL
jgi:pyruvate dehydrogenase E2 component (dihydrolipoamide acetyltransferase)